MRPSSLLFASSGKLLGVSDSAAVRSWLSSLNSKTTFLKDHTADYSLSFSKSSGPGGQNVNKLNTKATVRLDLDKAKKWLPGHVINNLQGSPSYAGSSNSLILSSMKHRTQAANSDDCMEKLHLAIISAAKIDYSKGLQGETSPDQKQRVQRYIQADKARTMRQKIVKSTIKQGRGKVAAD